MHSKCTEFPNDVTVIPTTMADSPGQETLLNRIPEDILNEINSGPRDIYEKVHQRELLLIEQIKHFSEIRINELANYGRNLLQQRQYEESLKESRASLPQLRPVLKSIVKRNPSKMEKRVSFSELPPEVEEFYSQEGERDDTDSDSDDILEAYHGRFDFKVVESDSEEDATSKVPLSDDWQATPEQDLSPIASTPLEVVKSPTRNFDQPSVQTSPQLSSFSSASTHNWSWRPSLHDEPDISFEDALDPNYTEEVSKDNNPEQHETDKDSFSDVPTDDIKSPLEKHPIGFVGSAPIDIGIDSLIHDHELPVGESPDVAGPLNPANMSFSQRMAWEERPTSDRT